MYACDHFDTANPPTSHHYNIILWPMIWALMAQWIGPITINHEVSGLNSLSVAGVPLGMALHFHCHAVLRRGLNVVGPLVAYSQTAWFFKGLVRQSLEPKSFQFISIYWSLARLIYMSFTYISGTNNTFTSPQMADAKVGVGLYGR